MSQRSDRNFSSNAQLGSAPLANPSQGQGANDRNTGPVFHMSKEEANLAHSDNSRLTRSSSAGGSLPTNESKDASEVLETVRKQAYFSGTFKRPNPASMRASSKDSLSSRASTVSLLSNSKRRQSSSSPDLQRKRMRQRSISSSPAPPLVRTSAQFRPSRPRKRKRVVSIPPAPSSSSSDSELEINTSIPAIRKNELVYRYRNVFRTPSPTSSQASSVPPNQRQQISPFRKPTTKTPGQVSPDISVGHSDDSSTRMTRYGCVSTPGTIKSVTLVNIMSHTYFSKNWSPTFNFIIGENGSGKSALLSGIVAGLGGKAFDIGRTISMRDIIRNGQTKARIEIVLNNYPSKLYGNEITIVRNLSRDGSSRYQIRDSNNSLRSLGRQELNLVLSKLNIQVDNPLAILHQEISRNFLRTKDPSVLYGYFHRALLLGSCETLLAKSTEDLHNAENCLESKKAFLDDLRLQELELKKQVEVIEVLRNGKQTLQKLRNEYTWAVVKEYEEIYKTATKALNDAVRRLQEASEERASIASRAKEVQDNQQAIKEAWQSVSNSLVIKTGEYETKRKEAHSVRMVTSEVSSKLKIVSEQLVASENTLKNLKARVEEHRHNLENCYERQMREIESKKQRINEQLEEHAKEMQEMSKRHDELVASEEGAAIAEEQSSMQLSGIKRKIDERKQELNELEKAKRTKYDVYGREIVNLMERIKTAKFIKQPRGPLGCCFTVKDESWAPLVEFVMSSSLCSFAVDNQQDRNTLHRLVDEVYLETGRRWPNKGAKRPSLCLMSFGDRMIDVSGGQAKCQYPTILDVIDIVDNDFVVYNWLVDSSRVERILLFKNYAEACDLMKDRNIIPRTALRGYSLDGYLFFPDPNFKALVQQKMKPAKLIQVTRPDYISVSTADNLNDEIRMMENEHQRLKEQYRQCQGHTRQVHEELKQNNVAIRGLSSRQNRLKSELRTLETSVFNVPDIATWMDEIEATNERIAAKQHERKNLQREAAELEAKSEKIELRIVEGDIMRLQSKQRHLIEQANSAELKNAELRRELREKESLCTSLHKAKMEATKQRNDSNHTLKNLTKTALTKCERMTNLSGTAREIKLQWETLNAELAKNQRKISQRDHVVKAYQNAKAIADKVEDEICIMSLLIQLTQPKIKLLEDHFRRKMLEYGIAVRTCFRNLIKSRGYWGDLAMSHSEKTLMCFVGLDAKSENRARQNLEPKHGQQIITSKTGIMEYASGMSGGERSFTTVCFLIACWQLMDMPFYILDEFDVFMDTFNRRISEYILMNVAKSKPHAQFFLFSPLSLDTAPPPGAITLKLFKNQDEEDPERNDSKTPLRLTINY